MQDLRLTPTSYIVLGLLSLLGEATPYELKGAAASSIGSFWSLQHAQFYTEPERLARAGYVREEREEGGRRRKHYRLTAEGRRALEAWARAPTGELAEVREPALLRLFFGADPRALATVQAEAHRVRLAEFEGLRQQPTGERPRGPSLALEYGIAYERMAVEFWERLAREGEPHEERGRRRARSPRGAGARRRGA